MKPEWRTDTVVSLCLSMRETQDFGALPILADVLQDVDCDNEWLLAQLRCGTLTYHESVRLVSMILSDETSDAVKSMEQLATEVHYQFQDMIVAGKLYLQTGDMYRDPNGDNWAAENLFYDFGDSEADYNAHFKDEVKEHNRRRGDYWRLFFLITGMNRPQDFRGSCPFICPC